MIQVHIIITHMEYWTDNEFAPCVSQRDNSDTELETLGEKIELSIRVLDKAIYLVEQIPIAVDHPQHPDNLPELRNYLERCNEILLRYCNHYQLCDRILLKCTPDLSVKLQIVILSDEQYLC